MIPRDSRDKDWQGPKTKTELRILDCYFWECLQAATCEDDLFAMENSPEWKEWLIQCEHDVPSLIDDSEYSILTILENKRREF